ncbi:MAG: NADH-quinone oxidoreductase subunit NuoE [Methylacidiphilales bacterium]|nr:NADH-quinone oxidoreductase subunit NuoE [Candidatus Methylacidiphilales bacterium]
MSVSLPAELEKKIDEVITHYPVSKRSASLPVLHLWQEQFGFISDEAIEFIAKKLDLQPVHILELVTFYPMFRREAIGKHHIKVCRTLSCALGGAHETHACFKKQTGAQGDDHGPISSPDGKYTIEYVECLAACGTAPVVMVNDDFYENVGPQKAGELLNKYK